MTPPPCIERCHQGKGIALETLVDQNLPILYAFFRSLSVPASEVEDLIQETFAKAIQGFDRYNPARSFTSWLLTIARNTLIDQRRRATRSQPSTLQSPSNHSSSPVEEQIISRDQVDSLLAAIPEEDKSLIELKVFAGLTFPEIAQLTGENPTTLRVRFFRIMKRLRIASEQKDAKQS